MASHDEDYLTQAVDQADMYLRRLDQALQATDPDDMRHYIQDAIPFGRNVLVNLEELLDTNLDPDAAECIESAMQHVGASLDFGDRALSASVGKMVNSVTRMRDEIEFSMGFIRDVSVSHR